MRPLRVKILAYIGLSAAAWSPFGCSSTDQPIPTSPPLPGAVRNAGSSTGAGPGGAASDGATGAGAEAGAPLVPNGSVPDPGPGGLYLTASGEPFAVTGYDFPPASQDATFLVDGWILRFERLLVTVDHVELWESPDMVPADPSQHGPRVAHADGPWAIDLHLEGPLAGEGGGSETAQPFAAIRSKDDGSAFDTTVRYGFGFATVPASASAKNVNLDADALAEYADMIANGYAVLYVGTATRPADDPCSANGETGYDFTQLPKKVRFRLGFATPTHYVNCQNGSEFPGLGGINGEDYPRGVQFRSDRSIIGQVTMHADHPFWESFAEGASLRFDPIAARYAGLADPVASIEDMKGLDFRAFTDRAGKPLPLRSCVDPSLYSPPYPAGRQLHFDPLTVPVDRGEADPSKALRDYFDYMRFTQSTQGHLNSQGLCFISRDFPAPPGGS